MDYQVSRSERAEAFGLDVAAETLPINNDQMVPLHDAGPAIPRYLSETYTWAYLNPRSVQLLDRELVVAIVLWYQHRNLRRKVLAEIEPGSSVLQTACVYGDFSPLLAQRIGVEGSLDIVDVSRAQVDKCAEKMRDYPFASLRHLDVLDLGDGDYDTVCSYFLMHEVPDDYKHALVDIALNNIGPDGKVVFIDYHKPHWANPLKPVMSLVFDTLEPFAKSLWRKDIRDFASRPEKFRWHKESFFGGLYQKVVATPVSGRRASDKERQRYSGKSL
jgi:ubiquinone/menaquinone biosynthesis C-methylase UbiE